MSSSLILYNNNESFLYWIVRCNKKWILHNNWQWPIQWSDLEEAPKRLKTQPTNTGKKLYSSQVTEHTDKMLLQAQVRIRAKIWTKELMTGTPELQRWQCWVATLATVHVHKKKIIQQKSWACFFLSEIQVLYCEKLLISQGWGVFCFPYTLMKSLFHI